MINQTIFFNSNEIGIADTVTIAGPKEGQGPLKEYFHNILDDDLLKQKSYEKAETKIHISAIRNLLNKTGLTTKDIDCVFAGDLLDEMIVSSYALREFDIPFMGLYNACASFAEALIIGSSMLESSLMNRVICSTSSHFSTAERQYRFPLEYGNQRTPLAQWTVTGAGCAMLERNKNLPIKIKSATIGKVVDYGITDVNNLGSAMLPSAMDTILTHLKDTHRDADYYDLILTGDLGQAASNLLKKLIKKDRANIDKNHQDCGVLIFDAEKQKNINQGGSGTACCNLVFNAYVYKMMLQKRYKKVLFVPTGALMSKIASFQGESIPGIAHAVSLEVE